jgi:hypothetical protein
VPLRPSLWFFFFYALPPNYPQFVVIMLHALFHMVHPELGFPRIMVYVELGLMVQMLLMFGEFIDTSCVILTFDVGVS